MLTTHQRDGVHQRFISRVGFDATEALHIALAERGLDFGQGAVAFGAAAAVKDQHAGIGGDQGVELGDAALAEYDAGGVVVVEVQHCVSYFLDFYCQNRASVSR